MTLQDRIAELVQQYGSIESAARSLNISVWQLAPARFPDYQPSEYFVTALGLRRVVSYERIDSKEQE